MDRAWLYFGCHQRPGHYLFGPGMRSVQKRGLERFDGMLAPHDVDEREFVASVTRLGGWGLTALAFWDRTVDDRRGSNSIFFAPSLSCSDESILAGAEQFFPQVWARLPDIRLYEPPGKDLAAYPAHLETVELPALPRAPASPMGCICPPTAEQTCQAPLCPRRNPLTGAGSLGLATGNYGAGGGTA